MRFIVYGVGGIGGTIAASLAMAGKEVAGIARGAQLEAIRGNGLLFRTPDFVERVTFPCFAAPSDLAFRPDDVIFLTMKSQDTHGALEALRNAGVHDQPIVCAQNGIANERMALRYFPNVYAATVMLPATYTVPGEVNCHGTPKRGMIDIGRYPTGSDDVANAIAANLDAANLAAFVMADVMRSKHGKLLENQRNVIEAALGPGNPAARPFHDLVQAEGEGVYRAAGIDWIAIGSDDPRRKGVLEIGEIAGHPRSGGSSTQSLERGTGSIETDYLNGEIVLLGRLHGMPVPVNAYLCDLGRRMVAAGMKPGGVGVDELTAGLRAAGATI
jgi:2-dehydropantoate 2-reductase